jgi:multiple sugar transport system ATP-binding protein
MNFFEGNAASEFDAHTIGIRPEHMDSSTTSGKWKGVVRVSEHLGSDTFLHVQLDDIGPALVRVSGDMPVSSGDSVFVTPRTDELHRFDAQGLTIKT